MIDLDAVRAETPGCRDHVFLDSAGSSLPPDRVLSAMTAHLRREAQVGGYRAAEERSADLEAVRHSFGRLLGCEPGTVSFSDSATRSWAQVVTAMPLGPGDRVLVTGAEYVSNAVTLLQRAQVDGIEVQAVPSTDDGTLDVTALERMLDERVRVVSLVHVPTSSGLVNPVAPVVALAHAVGARVLLDACQSVGQLALDAAALGVDALTGTGRKWLRGPRGTGFAHVRSDLLEELRPVGSDNHGAEWTADDAFAYRPGGARLELFETAYAARLGLGAAVDLLLDLGPEEVEAAVRSRAARLRGDLAALDGVEVHDPGEDLAGTVTFTVDGVPAARVRDRLREQAVTVSVSSAGSARLDLGARGLDAVVRASPHYFVTDEQLDQAVAAVAACGPTPRSGRMG